MPFPKVGGGGFRPPTTSLKPSTAPSTSPSKGPSAASVGAQIVGTHADALQAGQGLHGATKPSESKPTTPLQQAQHASDVMSAASSGANVVGTAASGGQFISQSLAGKPPAGMPSNLFSRFAGRFGPAAGAFSTATNAANTYQMYNNPHATPLNVFHAGSATALSALSMVPNPVVSVPASILGMVVGTPEQPK